MRFDVATSVLNERLSRFVGHPVLIEELGAESAVFEKMDIDPAIRKSDFPETVYAMLWTVDSEKDQYIGYLFQEMDSQKVIAVGVLRNEGTISSD
ncbi:hypothetical protein [Lacticaseibacillus saniviri]